MCGVAGILYKERPIEGSDHTALQSVLERLSYRGPDGWGIWEDKHILLGHRRLSIIDLSAAGAQPFTDKMRGLTITFNGEIYNYREIRNVLEHHGYTFRSNSDTEVILCCYDFFGLDFLAHLRGMFAFCLYDKRNGKALLVRDRIGKKPLYYSLSNDVLLFASEIKAFHGLSYEPLQIDPASLSAYLHLQYIPDPHSIYRGIKKIKPGEFLQIHLKSWNSERIQYWSPFEEAQRQRKINSLEELDEKIGESVRYRLVADVEVALLLSGGVDSSLIASYAALSKDFHRAFTATFQQSDLDELLYASQVASAFGMTLHPVEGDTLDSGLFQEIIYHADEPLGDPACIPTYLISKALSKYVKVVLSGEGADELFYGYDYYRLEHRWKYISWLQALIDEETIPDWLLALEAQGSLPSAFSRMAKVLTAEYDLGSARWTSVFSQASAKRLLNGNVNSSADSYLKEMEETLHQFQRYAGTVEGAIALDLAYWLPGDLLTKVDRMTMAHSLEARAPFLDHEVIGLAIAMPSVMKMRGRETKAPLRQLLKRKLPNDIAYGIAFRRKHGFETPVASWMRNELRELAEERFSEAALSAHGLIRNHSVQQLWNRFLRGGHEFALRRKLWLLLVFQTWYSWHERKFGFTPRQAKRIEVSQA